MENITLSLAEIEILKLDIDLEYFNKEDYEKNYKWQLAADYKILPANDESVKIKIEINMFLPHFYFPDNIVANIKTCSSFSIKGNLSIKSKLQCMAMLMSMSLANLQGYYIAKVEGTELANTMPPTYDFKQIQNNFKYRIEDEWK